MVVDLSAAQINPSNYRGYGTQDTGHIEIAEELVRIMQYTEYSQSNQSPNWDSITKWANTYLSKGILPLLLIDHRFHKLSDSFWMHQAYSSDSDNGQLKKVGPWQKSDFTDEDAFYFIPFYSKINASVHSLILDERFMFSNRKLGKSVTLGVDINGNQHIILPNVPTPLLTMQTGINMCHLYLEADSTDERFENNLGISMSVGPAIRQRLFTLFKLHTTVLKPEWQTITEGLPIDQFDVTAYVTHENKSIVQTGAKVSIHYGNGPNGVNPCLKKPIIFVEGIDFGYRNQPTGCKDGKCGNTGYIDLLKGKQWDVETQSWSEWASIEHSPQILKQYRDSGYDIVYIDFYDGADYIENNAVVVYKAIKEISNRLCGEHIHVVGASMGALVARRALTMIENDTIQHCIRSYTSFDGPLLGANIPVALQASLNYYSGVSGKLLDLKKRMLDRPASKQMLLIHYQNQDKPHELFTKFMSDSTMQAFPSQPWRFAIINGSDQMFWQRADNFQELIPGDSIIHFNIGQPLFGNIKATARVLGGKPLSILASILPESDAKTFTYARTLPGLSPGVGTVALFKTTYKKKTNHEVNLSAEGLDQQSGGKSSFALSLHNGLKKQPWLIFSELYASNSCFIPTWSGIGSNYVKDNQNEILEKSIGREPLMLKNTPFHDYYSQSENQDHVMFEKHQTGNAIWLLKKLITIENQNFDRNSNSTFIGNTFDKFIGSIEIEENQSLNINCEFDASKMKPSAKNAVTQLKKRVFVLGNCKAAEITISGGAVLNLGSGINNHQTTELQCKEYSTIIVEKGGILNLKGGNSTLRILKNAKLILLAGSKIVIQNGSQLIIEAGSELFIGENVHISLNGETALLHAKGSVKLAEKATILVKSDSGFATGMVKLSNIGGGFGNCKISGGGKAKLFVRGNDANASTVLQIEGEINTSNIFDSISIQRANIKFGNYSKWIVDGNVEIKNSGFFSTEWSKNGQDGLVFKKGNLQIDGCSFYKLNTGLQLYNESPITLKNTTFISCTTGLLYASNGTLINHCKFKNNVVGIELFGNEKLDTIILSDFTGNVTGITTSAEQGTTPLHVIESTFYNNTIGIESNRHCIALACNVFGYNTLCIKATETSIIAGAHSQIKIQNDTLNCGNNTFAYSQKNSIQLNGAALFLNGNNNFIVSNNLKPQDKVQITGFLPSNKQNSRSADIPVFKTGKNHWFPVDQNDNSDSIQAKYLSVGTIDIGGRWYEVEATIFQIKKVNTLCFDPTSSLEAARRAANKGGNNWENNQTSLETQTSLELKIPNNASIYTVDGRLITPNPFKTNWYEGLSEGFYLIQWHNENQESIARKVFISASAR